MREPVQIFSKSVSTFIYIRRRPGWRTPRGDQAGALTNFVIICILQDTNILFNTRPKWNMVESSFHENKWQARGLLAQSWSTHRFRFRRWTLVNVCHWTISSWSWWPRRLRDLTTCATHKADWIKVWSLDHLCLLWESNQQEELRTTSKLLWIKPKRWIEFMQSLHCPTQER